MRNKTIKDIINVTGSNIVSLIGSILSGFVIPVLLGPINYGYYKIFTLYASYTALFHFGFEDGIMLTYGGRSFDSLNKYKFRANTVFFLIFELIISTLIVLASFFTTSSLYKILFIVIGINCLTQNVLGYYQNISQTVMKFNNYAIINSVQSILLIISILCLLFYSKIYHILRFKFTVYVFIVISINMMLGFWYMYYYRRITFGKRVPLLNRFRNFKHYFISGSYMTFAYGIGVLIFNLDSQFVVKLFSIRTYSMYAFAYSMFSAGLLILSSAATVLLPHLKNHSSVYILKNYSKSISIVILLMYLAISGYFPLTIIIHYFLFDYYKSLVYFRILLPGIVITCCVTIVISNYYSALNKVKFNFYLDLCALFITFIIDLIFYLIFKTPSSLALASTLSLIIWYILSDHFIVKKFHLKWKRNIIYIILMMIIFFIFSYSPNIYIGLMGYLSTYMIISFIFFKHNIIQFITKIL